MNRHAVTALLATLLACAALPAVAAPPAVHAIEGARLVIAPGQVVDRGTVVMRDGVFTAVGAAVEIPADARVWDGEGLTLYPGLIDPFVPVSLPAADDEEAAPAGGNPNPLVTPERDAAPYANDEKVLRKLREAGFTTALAVPEDGLLRGTAALVNLGDGDLRHNLLRRGVAQVAALEQATEGYPTSLMGSMALLRQTLLDASWYARAQAAYATNPAQERPPLDLSAAALAPVVSGEMPLIYETRDLRDSLRGARLAQELELTAWLVGNGHEYQRLDDVLATGLPLLLPVDFPKAPVVKGEDDLSVDLEALRHWDRAPDNPRLLLDGGLTVAFTAHGLSDAKALHANLAEAIERGLSPEAALAALTTTPAELLGITPVAGTLEPGKMANLVVVEGELFVDKPKIRQLWIDGQRLEIKESKPPEVDPVGTWELTVVAGGQQIPVTLRVGGELEALSGSIGAQGQFLPLTEIEVSGSTLNLSFDSTPFGMPGEISMSLDIEAETADGKGQAPQGPFTVSGNRTSSAPPEVIR
jgi:imidazolonepropionase-like amidohydrolase